MLVLISGIVLLLIVLPFAFIRFFYAPWLEAQLRLRAPREAPADLREHVVICHYDAIARRLIERLDEFEVPCRVIEADLVRASALHADGVHRHRAQSRHWALPGSAHRRVPIHNTGVAGRTIRETRLRALTGLNIAATWERGKLRPAAPETLLSDYSVPVIVGTQDQLTELDAMFAIYEPNEILANPTASTQLSAGSGLVMLGTPNQRHVFRDRFA